MRRPLFARAVKTRVVVARSRAGGHIMGYTKLLLERAGAIATLTLNRPDARNALDLVMRGELLSAQRGQQLSAHDQIERIASVRAVERERGDRAGPLQQQLRIAHDVTSCPAPRDDDPRLHGAREQRSSHRATPGCDRL